MKKVIVVGCPGSGKSTFARKLQEKTGLPLYYLDMIWHKPDKTTLTKEEFDEKLHELIARDEWIIDGNYSRTLEPRLQACDTAFVFDLPLEVCLAGAQARVGTKRIDMPWEETELSQEFLNYILSFSQQKLPRLLQLARQYSAQKQVVFFRSRRECDDFLKSL
ncbi:MAG TPA: hypothetical protein H9741_01785 [Candidatus Borkfalkia faecipullorum]|uniref:Adenylate kinase n=1 Tax=Candidatus Borkfalkia faecipullorum TaxID=2838510 RepID=A0A9D2AFS5_9FIRM|nr:hypothetical protein [Candidatus Borkfalkia faecipullorum]